MKTRLIVLLLCLPFMAFCQFSSSLDVMVGSEFSYRNLLTTSSDDPSLQFTIENKEQEVRRYNWRFGINYNRQLSQKFYLKTGVRFANVGYVRNQFAALQWGTQHDGAGGFDPTIDPQLFSEFSSTYNYTFIEIPIIGRYQLNENKWSPFLELGVSPMLSLQKSGLRDYNKLHLTGNLSVGMNYTPFENLQFFAQPIFRYHFTELTNDAAINENLYNYGIEFGVRRKI